MVSKSSEPVGGQKLDFEEPVPPAQDELTQFLGDLAQAGIDCVSLRLKTKQVVGERIRVSVSLPFLEGAAIHFEKRPGGLFLLDRVVPGAELALDLAPIKKVRSAITELHFAAIKSLR